jgi:hypothetical protein
MSRGGINKGTMKPSWRAGKTTVVRIPIAFKQDVMALCRALDLLEGKGIVLDKDVLVSILDILKFSLTLPSNKGGAIKEKIRDVIGLLEFDD